ncbi:hypothetical protein ACFQ4C_07705 [Larkinella insperata]|uniref:Uncharacterized protein n=1 Tax=Larkinella insperata TaxID=332158 RepID=A0ABW3Q6N2_9BACT
MAGDWEMAPPLSDNQFPSVSPGARIEKSFKIIKQKSENEILTCLHWTGLSRQQISILRNLTSSTQLQQLLRPYGYGISSGISIDLSSKKDPLDAEYDLMVSSKKEIKPEIMNKIVNFVKRYRVR